MFRSPTGSGIEDSLQGLGSGNWTWITEGAPIEALGMFAPDVSADELFQTEPAVSRYSSISPKKIPVGVGSPQGDTLSRCISPYAYANTVPAHSPLWLGRYPGLCLVLTKLPAAATASAIVARILGNIPSLVHRITPSTRPRRVDLAKTEISVGIPSRCISENTSVGRDDHWLNARPYADAA